MKIFIRVKNKEKSVDHNILKALKPGRQYIIMDPKGDKLPDYITSNYIINRMSGERNE